MEENEKDFSPVESLQLITNMINSAKNRFAENGFLYLLWGWVVFICGLIQFILRHFYHYEKSYLVWIAIWPVIIYHFYYVRKKIQTEKALTYADHLIKYVWIAFLILAFIFSYLGRVSEGNSGNYYAYINPIMLAIYGMPVFLSGIILQFKPLIIGGIGCWILSILAPFVTYDYQFLFLPAAMIIAWIIPGYLLRNQYQKQKKFQYD